jgi:hypothetical protein
MKDAASLPADLVSLLAELPPESLGVVTQFARFLYAQAQQGRAVQIVGADKARPYLYPTVALPAASLDALIGIMPPVEGDALEDSESLYDGD